MTRTVGDDPFHRMVRVRTRRRNGKRVFVSWRIGRSAVIDDFDYREDADERPSPIARIEELERLLPGPKPGPMGGRYA